MKYRSSILLILVLAGCNSSLAYYGTKTPGRDPIIDPTVPQTETTQTGDTSEPTGTDTTDTDTTDTDTIDTDTDTDTDTTDTLPTDTGTAPQPWSNGDPTIPPPYTAPPAVYASTDCEAMGGIEADLDDDEVDVLSYDGPLESRTLTSSVSGWYDLYDREMSHEESGEWNESAMVRVGNLANPTGLPALSNCESNWVTADPDNYTDPGDTLLYIGTFWFEVGDNELQLEHLCPRVRLGSCAELEFLEDSDTTCASDDGNSAHLDGEHLCMVLPAL